MTLVTLQSRVMLAVEDCSRNLAIRAGLRAPTAALPWSARGGVVRPRLDCRSLGRVLIRDCPNRTNPASHCQTTFASSTGFSPRSRASYRLCHSSGFYMGRAGAITGQRRERLEDVPTLPRKCAAFFLESPVPYADAHSRAADVRFQRRNPHRQAHLNFQGKGLQEHNSPVPTGGCCWR